MADQRLTDAMRDELSRLELLPDDDIDTSDAPEVTDWSTARRAAFYEGAITQRNYDIRALANWILDRLTRAGIAASNLSLNKLLYFAFERFLVERGVQLSMARIEAWDHGPVFREVYYAFNDNDRGTIRSRISVFSIDNRKMTEPRPQLQREDADLLGELVDTYARLSAPELTRLSHLSRSPWHRVWSKAGRINPGMQLGVATILLNAPARRQTDERRV